MDQLLASDDIDVEQLVREDQERQAQMYDTPLQRVAQRIYDQGYTPDQLFHQFDDDCDEILTKQEIESGFRKMTKLELNEDDLQTLIQEIDQNTDGVLTLEEWETVLAPKVQSKQTYAKIMEGLNISDPIELEEKILDLRYRTSWLRNEVNLLKKMHQDQFGVTLNEKDKRREQHRKKKGEQEKLVSEIKSLESKFLEKQKNNKNIEEEREKRELEK